MRPIPYVLDGYTERCNCAFPCHWYTKIRFSLGPLYVTYWLGVN